MENNLGQVVLVKDIVFSSEDSSRSSSPSGLIVYNERLYFAAEDLENGREIWTSDGTAEGTQLFKDINPGAGDSLYSGYFTEFQGKLTLLLTMDKLAMSFGLQILHQKALS